MIITTYEALAEARGNEALLEGNISREKFRDKRNREYNFYETWFTFTDGRSALLRGFPEEQYLENQGKTLRIKVYVHYGLIDTTNPEVQSRVGYRLDFISLA